MSDETDVRRPWKLITRTGRGEFWALLAALVLFVAVLFTLLPVSSDDPNAVTQLPVELHARVTADYSLDPLGTSHPPVGLGIIEAVLVDDHPPASGIEDRIATMTQGISLPVPSSTPVFPEHTETATLAPVTLTWTASLTRTASPSATFSNTGSAVPSSTLGTPGTPAPTATATVTLPPGVTPSATMTFAPVACETYPTTGLAAAQDTWVDSTRPNASNESQPKLEVEPGTQEKLALMQFDLTSIPIGSNIQSATVYLNVIKSASYTVEFREIFAEWPENVTWLTQPEFDLSFVSGSLELSPNQSPNCVRAVPLDLALVEYWIDNPDLNFGLVLVGADVAEKSEFSSRESARPPRLIVIYTQ